MPERMKAKEEHFMLCSHPRLNYSDSKHEFLQQIQICLYRKAGKLYHNVTSLIE